MLVLTWLFCTSPALSSASAVKRSLLSVSPLSHLALGSSILFYSQEPITPMSCTSWSADVKIGLCKTHQCRFFTPEQSRGYHSSS